MIKSRSFIAATAMGVACLSLPAAAAETTPQRLLNAVNEPHNWLMVNQAYDQQRWSRLSQINRDTVKGLKAKFMFSIGGWATHGNLRPANYGEGNEQAVPLVEDGFMYVPDTLNKLTKLDVRNGNEGIALWRFDPKVERSRLSRGVALLGNNVYNATHDGRLIAINKESGEAVWEINALAPTDPATGTPSPTSQGFSTGPMTVKNTVLVGEATGGSRGTRSWVGAWDATTGKLLWRTFTIPGPGEPGHETWKDGHGAWKTGGAGVWSYPAYDPVTNVAIYGTGDAFPTYDPEFRPGDNLYTVSTIALNLDTGKIQWFFQETPNEQWDLDSVNARIIYEVPGRDGPARRVSNFARNGFFYTYDLSAGQFFRADAYQDNINWTKGIDPKTGKPVEYNPAVAVQNYLGKVRRGAPEDMHCPNHSGSPTYWPSAYDAKTMIAYSVGVTGCRTYGITTPMDANKNYVGQVTCCFKGTAIGPAGAIWGLDIRTGAVVKKLGLAYPNESGLLGTAGGLIFTGHPDGKVAAYDSDTLEQLWSFSTGTNLKAAPMTYSIGGQQYVAIVVGGDNSPPEGLLLQPSASVVVFGL
jgi:alcohol dehydrogenase (cytochrome c)